MCGTEFQREIILLSLRFISFQKVKHTGYVMMSKIVRLDEDVYFALKARTSKEGKTLSKAVHTLMHTADYNVATEKRLDSLESKIKELKSLLFSKESSSYYENQKQSRGRDSNPRHGLHRAVTSAHRANVP
jgi:hypothetical protein